MGDSLYCNLLYCNYTCNMLNHIFHKTYVPAELHYTKLYRTVIFFKALSEENTQTKVPTLIYTFFLVYGIFFCNL